MKHLTSFLLLFPVLAGILLGGCQGNGKMVHYQAIPANATMLYSVHLETILQTSGVGDKIAEHASRSAVHPALTGILKDRASLGLDLDDLLFFLANAEAPAGVNFPRVGFAARITDHAKFLKTLGLLKDSGRLSITKKKDYSVAIVSGMEISLTFNKKVVVGLAENDREEAFASQLLAQSKDKSILADEKIARAFAGKEEFKGYIDFRTFSSFLPVDLALPEAINMAGIAKLGFPDGAIRLETRVLSADSTLLARQAKQNRPATLSQLAYFPDSPLFISTTNVNGEEAYTFMQKFFNEAARAIPPSMNTSINTPVIETLSKIFEIYNSIDGDFTLGILPGMPVPSFLLYAKVKDTRLLNVFNKFLSREYIPLVTNRTELAPDNYRVDLSFPGLSLFYGVKDGQFVLTNEEKRYANANAPTENSFKDSALAKRIPKGTTGYFLLDFQPVLQTVSVVTGMLGHAIPPQITETLSRVRYLEGFVESEGNLILQVEFSDPKTNVLKLIGEIIKFEIH
ncbi:MAG: DUF4836 family protein [Odoribacteraceae bacterium]|jgi:hypothetical protein|nr:DUF4836 family protein [Odoribacteraceae bacterium]